MADTNKDSVARRYVWFASLVAVASVAAPQGAEAQWGRRAASELSRHHPDIRRAGSSVVQKARRATVLVKCSGRSCAYGAIVDSDGWIVTKASELDGDITCVLATGRSLEAEEVDRNRVFDLALLKVDASMLPVVPWTQAEARAGQIVLTPSSTQRTPVGLGVVSAPAREIERGRGFLGVRIDDSERGPIIRRVEPGSSAERAGLSAEDIVTHVNETLIRTSQQLIEQIGARTPGTRVSLRFLRAGREAVVTARLGTRFDDNEEIQRLLGKLSEQRTGYPIALQHDTVLQPQECGGPLVGLNGEVIGINIARADRTGSYAIPAEAVREVVKQMIPPTTAEPAAASKREGRGAPKKKTTW